MHVLSLFRLIIKRSFNLLCVLDLFFSRTLAVNSVSDSAAGRLDVGALGEGKQENDRTVDRLDV